MNRALLFASVLSLAAVPTFAGAGTGAGHDAAGKEKSTTLTGCLSSTSEDGVYKLKTKSGTQSKDVEVRGEASLKEHVGHEVKITGTWMGDDAHKSGAAGAHEKETARTDTSGHSHHFMASSIQHVAETCKQ